METKEKNFEQDIESWLLTEGGYVYRGDRPDTHCQLLVLLPQRLPTFHV